MSIINPTLPSPPLFFPPLPPPLKGIFLSLKNDLLSLFKKKKNSPNLSKKRKKNFKLEGMGYLIIK